MKRRNFLGFLGGAAVAGPGLAREAAAKAAMSGASALGGGIHSLPMASSGIGQAPNLLQRALSATSFLRGMTRDQRAELKRRFGDVHRLDPDLASYHSLSMGARLEMQRERNVESFLASRKTWWEGVLDRGDIDYPNDPFNDI